VEGEEGSYLLELKLIADIGLVGYPNAGKSTLISRITRAHPRIAAYPFTTLRPVLGMVTREFSDPLVVADIPGLVEGAHKNVGLGHDFLRHIERTRALLLVLDLAGTDGRAALDDYRSLRRELKLHNPELVRKPFLVAVNKMDLAEAADRLPSFLKSSRLSPKRVFPISAKAGDGLERLKDALFALFE
jgi:GTP-binding protein